MMVRKAVEKEPDNAAYLDSLGWVLYKRGSFQESVGHLEKAVEKLEEGDSVIWDHLGDAYLRTDQVEKARTAWQKAVDLYRKQPQSNEKKIEEIQAKLNVTAD
jgi:Tfp pilus assembly protein PilF